MSLIIKKVGLISFSLLLSILIVSNIGVCKSTSQSDVYYNGNFDTMNSEDESGMVMYDSGTSLSLTSDPVTSDTFDKCILISRNTTVNAKGQAGYTFGQNGKDKPNGNFVVQFDFYLEQFAPTYLADLYGFYNGELKRVAYIRTTSSGGLMVYDNTNTLGTAVPGVAYTTGTWYSVVMAVDLDNDTTTYYMNGQDLGTFTNGVDITYLTRLDFGFHEQAPAERKLYIDDVYVFDYGDINVDLKVECSTDENGDIILKSDDVDIYYTTNGEIPTINSDVYTEPIKIQDKNIFIRAIAIDGENHGIIECSGPYSVRTVNGLVVTETDLGVSDGVLKGSATIRNYSGVEKPVYIIITQISNGKIKQPLSMKLFSIESDETIIELERAIYPDDMPSDFYMMLWTEENGRPCYPICAPEFLKSGGGV